MNLNIKILISCFIVFVLGIFFIIHRKCNLKKELTFAIIKPDAIRSDKAAKIIERIKKEGFEIIKMKELTLGKPQAELFYEEHKSRPFYKSLVEFMTSGPIIILALEKVNAVLDWRKLMGSTNPANAEVGTIRKDFGTSVQNNAVHGSDSIESAKREISLFFPELVK